MTCLLVCGGRNFRDAARLNAALDILRADLDVTDLIEGGARGADTLARRWAASRGVHIHTFPADWNQYGRSAGPIRNRKMLAVGKPDLVAAFPGGAGTSNMVSQARAFGVPVVFL